MISGIQTSQETREAILRKLVDELKKHKQVLGCFEGGSAAFGRVDEWSDIDFQIVVEDDFVEPSVKILEALLESISPIKVCYIMPAPTWHGHWQGFYQLQDISPFLLLDVLIMKKSSPSYFTEVEMHGWAKVFFDKTGKLGKEHINRQEILKTIPQRIKRIREVSALFHLFVDKEIMRGHDFEAFDMYNMLFRFAVELLRIKYDPARWSFGVKYLSYDFPPEVNAELKGLTFIRDFEDLKTKKTKVMGIINRLLNENLEKGIERRLPPKSQ